MTKDKTTVLWIMKKITENHNTTMKAPNIRKTKQKHDDRKN